jgi:hypothetical protein
LKIGSLIILAISLVQDGTQCVKYILQSKLSWNWKKIWQDLSFDSMTLTLLSLTLQFEAFGGALSDLVIVTLLISTQI